MKKLVYFLKGTAWALLICLAPLVALGIFLFKETIQMYPVFVYIILFIVILIFMNPVQLKPIDNKLNTFTFSMAIFFLCFLSYEHYLDLLEIPAIHNIFSSWEEFNTRANKDPWLITSLVAYVCTTLCAGWFIGTYEKKK